MSEEKLMSSKPHAQPQPTPTPPSTPLAVFMGERPTACFALTNVLLLLFFTLPWPIIAAATKSAQKGLVVAIPFYPLLLWIVFLGVTIVLARTLPNHVRAAGPAELTCGDVSIQMFFVAVALTVFVTPLGFVSCIYLGELGALDDPNQAYIGPFPLAGSPQMGALTQRDYLSFSPSSYTVWEDGIGVAKSRQGRSEKTYVYPITAQGSSDVVVFACVCDGSASGCRSFPALHSMGKTSYVFDPAINDAVRVGSSFASQCQKALESGLEANPLYNGTLSFSLPLRDAIFIEFNTFSSMKSEITTLLICVITILGLLSLLSILLFTLLFHRSITPLKH